MTPLLRTSQAAPQPFGIYVHIPFCLRKCAYCDFNSYPGLDHLFEPYVEALCRQVKREAESETWRHATFDTLFIGGGTPTVLAPGEIARVAAACRQYLHLTPDAEITLEANPGTVDLAGLRALREAGINRLSLGVQSLHDDELRLLGRIHTAQEAIAAYRWARRAGFGNINLDLIFGLPGQTVARWRDTLLRALALGPEHFSLYDLIVEDCTALQQQIETGVLPAPDDDAAADMYELSQELMGRAYYVHYEISNWARRTPGETGPLPRLASRHNLKYWRNERYLGVGAGAYSYDGQRRYASPRDPADYISRVSAGRNLVVEVEETGIDQQMDETMMLGLRLLAGISWDAFERRFGHGLRDVYGPQIDQLAAEGLLQVDEQGIRLTRRGRLLGNRVFGAFLRERY